MIRLRPPNFLRASSHRFLVKEGFLRQQRCGVLTTTLDDAGFMSIGPANLFLTLHQNGIPWLVTLPLGALIIRSLIIYPMLDERRRKLAKLASLQPLVEARISLRFYLEQWSTKKKGLPKPSNKWVGKWRARRMHQSVVQTYQEQFDIETYAWLSKIWPLIVLLAVSEAIRRLCGAKDGLLTVLAGPFLPIFQATLPSRWSTEGDYDSSGEQSTSLYEMDSVGDAKETLTSQDVHDFWKPLLGPLFTYQEDAIKAAAAWKPFRHGAWIQESLKGEGFSWCPDMSEPDPSHFLPAVFAVSFMASIWFSPKEEDLGDFYTGTADGDRKTSSSETSSETSLPKSSRRTILQKLMLGVGALSFFPAMDMPVALIWYYTFNIIIARLHTKRLQSKYPIVRPPVACSSRARMMSSPLRRYKTK